MASPTSNVKVSDTTYVIVNDTVEPGYYKLDPSYFKEKACWTLDDKKSVVAKDLIYNCIYHCHHTELPSTLAELEKLHINVGTCYHYLQTILSKTNFSSFENRIFAKEMSRDQNLLRRIERAMLKLDK